MNIINTTMTTTGLHNAKKQKNDEFYTQLSDIENEMQYHESHFKDKIIYCNCDDYRHSNFFRYFHDNFHRLGLKKVITTNHVSQYDQFFTANSERPIMCEYDGHEPIVTHLNGNGDFRSPECINILKQSDIIVTNPPFSLFRDHFAQIIKYDKRFIIVGNLNAVKYRKIFPHIMSGNVWLGASIRSGCMKFKLPDGTLSVVLARWFTNLGSRPQCEQLMLKRCYNPDDYQTYDNYDAINVDRIENIPVDYYGVMGVPITFIDKHHPDQFEIVGVCFSGDRYGLKTKEYTRIESSNYDKLNTAPVIKTDDGYRALYIRLMIRRTS